MPATPGSQAASGVRPPIRRLPLRGDAAQRGAEHGAAFRDEIRRYSDERVRLASNGSWAGRPATRNDVLDLARAMLPAHRAYSADLLVEMEAMAGAAGLSAEEALIVGGFTDFVDAVRGVAGEAPEEDDCTAALVPDTRAGGHGFLAQTWDMHDSATQHVVMLELEPVSAPRALVFSTVGCLGQIGMNEAGIAIGINNLAAAVGRVGVTWPFVVRKVLEQTELEAALRCVTDVELTGAHNYLLLDRHGRGYDVEAMPGHCEVEELRDVPLYHTNHCLAEATKALEAARAPALRESSVKRLRRAHELLDGARDVTLELLLDFTRDPVAICQRAQEPFHIESSGAVVMRPASFELWAVWGLPSENRYERFEVA
jgi:isopenicillin-N N-acyltransferase-like protein